MKLDDATERIKQIKESLRNEHGSLEHMRPKNIDVALGNEQL